MKTFLVNRSSTPLVTVRRNGQDINFKFNEFREVEDPEVAKEMAANNPNLTVVNQKETGRVFVRHQNAQTVRERYYGVPYDFVPNKYIQVESKEKADAIASSYNNATIGSPRFTVYVEGEKDPNTGEEFKVDEGSNEFVFLPEAEAQVPIK